MSKLEARQRKQSFGPNKFKTDLIVRTKTKEHAPPSYNTTPGDKYTCRHHEERAEKSVHFTDREFVVERREVHSAQYDYIKNNLCIKSCIGDREVLRFQMKKVSFRNYTPKILNQEVNMGMWI